MATTLKPRAEMAIWPSLSDPNRVASPSQQTVQLFKRLTHIDPPHSFNDCATQDTCSVILFGGLSIFLGVLTPHSGKEAYRAEAPGYCGQVRLWHMRRLAPGASGRRPPGREWSRALGGE